MAHKSITSKSAMQMIGELLAGDMAPAMRTWSAGDACVMALRARAMSAHNALCHETTRNWVLPLLGVGAVVLEVMIGVVMLSDGTYTSEHSSALRD